eukprot:GHRR01010192.1.p1 GENE.GHRR01010192.1~~GHRR01010192.1.p1  ORF type:complete len:368 (+),score=163.61 GHRR01010192.1:1855-2958(+)
MMEAKDNELLAALRKNTQLAEELSHLRQQRQQQPLGLAPGARLAQQGGSSSDMRAATDAAGSGAWGWGHTAALDKVTSPMDGAGADSLLGPFNTAVERTTDAASGGLDQGNGVSGTGGDVTPSWHGPGSLIQAADSSQQLLGNYAVSEPDILESIFASPPPAPAPAHTAAGEGSSRTTSMLDGSTFGSVAQGQKRLTAAVTAAGGVGGMSTTDMELLMRLAATQAQKEEELTAAREQISVLESEVSDLEKELALRSEMEAALKETLRELERQVERHNKGTRQVDMEYLKNLVLRLYTTGEAEALLPVFATLLALGPDEMNKCKAGLDQLKANEVPLPAAATAIDSAGSYLGSWSSWLGVAPTAPGGT